MIIDEYTKMDIPTLKSTLISGSRQEQAYGKKADLNEHLNMLKKEFIGKTALEFYHAATIVFIRRKLNLNFCKRNFFRLWEHEADFLCKNLSLRWLVSACDTIVDESGISNDKAIALACTVLINTIKLYETELITLDAKHREYDLSTVSMPVPTDLFDGLTAFRVGGGDMVKNLHSRVKTFKGNSLAEQILKECFSRIDRPETIYGRFKNIHKNKKTIW